MAKLGAFIIGQGEIPAGGDAYIVHRLMTAGSKPILLNAMGYYGGDANEDIQIGMVSPSMNASIGSKEWGEFVTSSNGIPVFQGTLSGNWTANEQRTLFGNYIRSPMGSAGFYLPPEWALVVYTTSANTNAWYITACGYECEEY